MYYVDTQYGQMSSSNLFETHEEALAEAQDRAGLDYETCFNYVVELKSVVTRDPIRHPVRVLEVTNETKHLICQEPRNETAVQATESPSEDEVQSEEV